MTYTWQKVYPERTNIYKLGGPSGPPRTINYDLLFHILCHESSFILYPAVHRSELILDTGGNAVGNGDLQQLLRGYIWLIEVIPNTIETLAAIFQYSLRAHPSSIIMVPLVMRTFPLPAT